MAAPTAMGPTKVKGNSSASAGPEAKSFALFFAGVVEGVSSGLSSEGILSEPRERFRIQPGGERDKHRDAERDGLRAAHDGPWRFAGRHEPGMHDNAEEVVERGHDVQHRKDREHREVRCDEGKEHEVR